MSVDAPRSHIAGDQERRQREGGHRPNNSDPANDTVGSSLTQLVPLDSGVGFSYLVDPVCGAAANNLGMLESTNQNRTIRSLLSLTKSGNDGRQAVIDLTALARHWWSHPSHNRSQAGHLDHTTNRLPHSPKVYISEFM